MTEAETFDFFLEVVRRQVAVDLGREARVLVTNDLCTAARSAPLMSAERALVRLIPATSRRSSTSAMIRNGIRLRPLGGVYCTLSEAIQGACNFCRTGSVVCGTGLVYGSTYTYVDTLNGDVATRLVYDKTGALVAALAYSANFGTSWRCIEGPTDFDPSEATSTPIFGLSERETLRQICGGADAGGD
jgi:hypothetical protein